MVFLASMLSAYIVHNWYETGMIYAIIIGVSAEIIYLSYTYKIIRQAEQNIRDKYNRIIDAYKERELIFEKQLLENQQKIKKLKEKSIEREKMIEKNLTPAALSGPRLPTEKEKKI